MQGVLFWQVLLSDGLPVYPTIVYLMIDRMKSLRSTLLVGLVTLVGGTLLFCFGRSFAVYIVARFLQGISSGVVWIVGFILFERYS